MDVSFKDFFSDKSADYHTYRPTYPGELFSYLASLVPARQLAWDCATGNGQAALALTDYFERVIATDASANQISNAISNSKVIYRTEPAEHTTLESGSVDLITVAQALHWFDLDAFATEVRRVLKPGGILAAWTYGLLTITPSLDDIIRYIYGPMLESYWPPERKLVDQGYQHIQFPLQPIPAPSFTMQTEWNLAQLVGYLCTWSAVKNYEQRIGENPVQKLYPQLAERWGDPDSKHAVHWPLTVKIWKMEEDNS